MPDTRFEGAYPRASHCISEPRERLALPRSAREVVVWRFPNGPRDRLRDSWIDADPGEILDQIGCLHNVLHVILWIIVNCLIDVAGDRMNSTDSCPEISQDCARTFSHADYMSATMIHGAEDSWKNFVHPLLDVKRIPCALECKFRAQAMVYNLIGALLIVTDSGRARYVRSSIKIQTDDLDHYILYMPKSGGATFIASEVAYRLRRLDIAIADLATPFDVSVGAGRGISLILPRARLAPLIEDAEGLHGRYLRRDTPAGALLGRHLLALARHASAMRIGDVLGHAEAAAHLAAACLAAGGARMSAASASGALGGIVGRQARNHIEANLHDPRLSPATLAEAFHLSRSQLYRLFERQGGVHRYIRGRRLRRALELVSRREASPRRISDIAYSLGFTDEAHFSRIFRESFGLSPRAARAAARRGEAHWLMPSAGGGNLLDQWLRELTLA